MCQNRPFIWDHLSANPTFRCFDLTSLWYSNLLKFDRMFQITSQYLWGCLNHYSQNWHHFKGSTWTNLLAVKPTLYAFDLFTELYWWSPLSTSKFLKLLFQPVNFAEIFESLPFRPPKVQYRPVLLQHFRIVYLHPYSDYLYFVWFSEKATGLLIVSYNLMIHSLHHFLFIQMDFALQIPKGVPLCLPYKQHYWSNLPVEHLYTQDALWILLKIRGNDTGRLGLSRMDFYGVIGYNWEHTRTATILSAKLICWRHFQGKLRGQKSIRNRLR